LATTSLGAIEGSFRVVCVDGPGAGSADGTDTGAGVVSSPAGAGGGIAAAGDRYA
jgi:hypothetical protein